MSSPNRLGTVLFDAPSYHHDVAHLAARGGHIVEYLAT